MNVKLVAGAAIVLLAIVGGFILGTHHGAAASLSSTSTISSKASGASSSNQMTTNSSKVLFSNTQYAQYAYLIYPGQMTQQAQSAFSGFNLTTSSLQNGSTNLTITLIGSNQAQSISLKPNYKLYIIETSFGDDGFHFDSSLGDDGFVVVDPNGYVA